MSEDTISVAIRVRPLVLTEIQKDCQMCLNIIPEEKQIQIRDSDKAFTFNYVFPPDVDQEEFYNTAVKGMVKNIFHGYNVTILAYGQTGSGKTHSMGTDYSKDVENIGIIPRAVRNIFDTISAKTDWTYKVRVSFIELYQETLYDLLTHKQRSQSTVDIREDSKSVKVIGMVEQKVETADEALACLTRGSMGRATGATAMNAFSSRSHAIFTLSIQQEKKGEPNSAITSKFHLVDLAGSERSKKTQATGERFKEGVNINKGLLALGNVISQLGESTLPSYVGYRDSKLTRLLQDSLGGNSKTLMIACISPADYNLVETLSTLRYADRARKIKNKPIVNQDPQVSEINRLNKLVQQLRLQIVDKAISESCPPEHGELQEKIQTLQKKIRDLSEKWNSSLIEIVNMHEKAELAERAREKIQSDMTEILESYKQLLDCFDTNPESLNELKVKLEAIYLKILDIQNDQKKRSKDLLNHEISLESKINAANSEEDAQDASLDGAINPNGPDSLDYFDEKQEEHTLRQTERNDEVTNINRELAIKQDLVSQLLRNSSMVNEYSKEVQEMEQEIKTLQAEKEELLQTLQNINTNNVRSKLAETRRKKVQELEKKIGDLTRKCSEQNRVIKMKEKQGQQIKILSSEIQSLKQTRVKLIRQMRNESDRFTKWKQIREKELNRLKDQDRKRINEMTRLKIQHNKQETVFKRKMEESFVVNKRLKEALDIQKKALQRREKAINKDGIRTWITQEINVMLTTVDAEYSLQKLMQHRTELAALLEQLRNNGDADENEITEIKEFLDLRNNQIADLQQKILESDQENRASIRWQTLHLTPDAKIALEILFDISAANQKKLCEKQHEFNELMDKHDLMEAQLEQYKIKEKERRISRRLTPNRTINIVPSETEELSKLTAELEMYKEKCRVLEENNSVKRPKTRKSAKPDKIVEECNNSADNMLVLMDNSDSEDDIQKDPDWRNTPIYNRIQKLWTSSRDVNAQRDESAPSKRSSDGKIKCACKTKCSTRLCSCRRNDVCCSNCNCNPETCQNGDKENCTRTLFLDMTDTESSKAPRLSTQ